MKNKRVTLSMSEINSLSIIEVDPSLIWNETDSFGNILSSQSLYPISIQLINDSGAGLEYNIITGIDDYADYLKDNSFYAFQRVPNGGIVQQDHTNFNRCYKFLIKGYEASATKDVYIEFINCGGR